jgi:hypothetical protein
VNISEGNVKGGSTTVPLTSCLTGLDQSVLQIKTKIVSSHTTNSKPVKQEVDSTMILHPLVFPDFRNAKMLFLIRLAALVQLVEQHGNDPKFEGTNPATIQTVACFIKLLRLSL